MYEFILIHFTLTIKLTLRVMFLLSCLLVAPNLLKAQSRPLEIIFTGNINGVLKNCGCGNPALGGLARIISRVNELRRQNPDLILVDGGDAFNSYSYPNLNLALLEMFALLKPDLWVPGDQEWVEGNVFLASHFPDRGYFLSNIETSQKKIKAGYVAHSDLGQPVYFLAYLDVRAFDIIAKPAQLVLREKNFRKAYQNRPDKSFVVVVLHGTAESLRELMTHYPKIDLILWAHAQSERIELSSKPAVIGAGSDGEYIHQIKVRFDHSLPEINLTNIPIGVEIQPDLQANKIIEKWNIK